MPGSHGSGPVSTVEQAGVVQVPVQHGASVVSAAQLPGVAAAGRRSSGRRGPWRGGVGGHAGLAIPAGSSVSPGTNWLAEASTYAALLVDTDVDPRVIMRILRHADQAVTMEIYANASSAATR